MTAIKARLSRVFAWIRARAAENSTRAGVAAALGALAAGASSLGSPKAALTLVAGAVLAGAAAAIKADPNMAAVAVEAVAVERAYGRSPPPWPRSHCRRRPRVSRPERPSSARSAPRWRRVRPEQRPRAPDSRRYPIALLEICRWPSI